MGLLDLSAYRESGLLFSMESDVHRLLEELERLGDRVGCATGRIMLGQIRGFQAQWASALQLFEAALAETTAAGSQSLKRSALVNLTVALLMGPVAADEGVLRCRAILADDSSRRVRAATLTTLGCLLAMRGEVAEARRLLRESKGLYEALGERVNLGMYSMSMAEAYALMGDRETAIALAVDSVRILQSLGEKDALTTAAAVAAHRLIDAGRTVEVAQYIAMAREADARDVWSQTMWRTAQARVDMGGRRPLLRREPVPRGQGAHRADRQLEPSGRGALHPGAGPPRGRPYR